MFGLEFSETKTVNTVIDCNGTVGLHTSEKMLVVFKRRGLTSAASQELFLNMVTDESITIEHVREAHKNILATFAEFSDFVPTKEKLV